MTAGPVRFGLIGAGVAAETHAREIRRLLPSVHVLLTTGYDRDMGNLDQVAPSEFDILKKPYRLSDLALRVRMALDGATGTRT